LVPGEGACRGNAEYGTWFRNQDPEPMIAVLESVLEKQKTAMVDAKRRCLEAWKAEFYPEPATVTAEEGDVEQCVNAGILKWTGLLSKNLAKHGLAPGDTMDHWFLANDILGPIGCALCSCYPDCAGCPLKTGSIMEPGRSACSSQREYGSFAGARGGPEHDKAVARMLLVLYKALGKVRAG